MGADCVPGPAQLSKHRRGPRGPWFVQSHQLESSSQDLTRAGGFGGPGTTTLCRGTESPDPGGREHTGPTPTLETGTAGLRQLCFDAKNSNNLTAATPGACLRAGDHARVLLRVPASLPAGCQRSPQGSTRGRRGPCSHSGHSKLPGGAQGVAHGAKPSDQPGKPASAFGAAGGQGRRACCSQGRRGSAAGRAVRAPAWALWALETAGSETGRRWRWHKVPETLAPRGLAFQHWLQCRLWACPMPAGLAGPWPWDSRDTTQVT